MSSSNRVINSAVESSLGFVYQYIVALKKCFDLREGETLWIEVYGDVTVEKSNKQSIGVETKRRSNDLTDNSYEFWNSLKNWLAPSFQSEQYASLILMTTQKFGSRSRLSQWNKLSPEARYQLLKDIHQENFSPQAKKSSVKAIQNSIFALDLVSDNEKLKSIISKLYIDAEANDMHELFQELRDTRCNRIKEYKKDTYLNSLLGFIALKAKNDNDWSISYGEFDAYMNSLSSQYSIGTHVFPSKYTPGGEHKLVATDFDKYHKSLFVKKILDIEFQEMIDVSIEEFVRTHLTLQNELIRDIGKNETLQYAKLVEDAFFRTYHLSSLKKEVSKIHFLTQTSAGCEYWSCFGSSPNPWFRNGLLHIAMDEIDKVMTWEISVNESD